MKNIKNWNGFNEINESHELGDTVEIVSDNENYTDFLDQSLRITKISENTQDHPGYDESMEGMMLFDLETMDGEDVPFSLYEYEVE